MEDGVMSSTSGGGFGRRDEVATGGEGEEMDCLAPQLYDDALLLVFGLLSARDLHRTSAVCSRWRAVAQADVLWRPLVWRTFGRADEAELRRQAHAPGLTNEDDAAMVGDADEMDGGGGIAMASWKTVYRGLIAEALPVQAILRDKTILILGDAGVGKTTYAQCYLEPQSTPSSIGGRSGHVVAKEEVSRRMSFTPLRGTGKHRLTLPTNYGPITVTLWDQPEHKGEMRDELLAAGQAIIIMFDITSRQTYNHVGLWHRAVTRVHQSAPMVLVGNKLDNHYQRSLQRKHVMFHRRMGMDYHEICALDNYNWAKPLESIFAKFTGKSVKVRTEELSLREPRIKLGSEFFEAIEIALTRPTPIPPAISAAYQAYLYAEGRM